MWTVAVRNPPNCNPHCNFADTAVGPAVSNLDGKPGRPSSSSVMERVGNSLMATVFPAGGITMGGLDILQRVFSRSYSEQLIGIVNSVRLRQLFVNSNVITIKGMTAASYQDHFMHGGPSARALLNGFAAADHAANCEFHVTVVLATHWQPD